MKHVNIAVKGKVQGVYFRLSTKAVADQLGVRGYVTNLPDGSVFVEAEGTDFFLDSLIDWCKEGPERAEVAEVAVTEAAIKGFVNFVVLKKPQV